jgi:hypothetical protein
VTVAPASYPSSEPLLWLQLLALGALPLEALLLLLVLAGADPGPVPGLERLLAWGLGVLAPTLVFWRRPADCCSLLLVQVPLGARSDQQRRLASLQEALAPRLLLVAGAALLLPAFWWLDRAAALAATSSPLVESNRFVCLVLAVPLLALVLWQWHQLSQSLWLLSRSPATLAAAAPLSSSSLEGERISLGIPLLLLAPLQATDRPAAAPPAAPAAAPAASAAPAGAGTARAVSENDAVPGDEPPEQQVDDQAGGATAVSAAGTAVAVEPEQAAEDGQSGQLDEQIP